VSIQLLAQTWLGFMWSALWQGSVALVIVWALCRVLPRISASIRCWWWRLALAKSLMAFLAIPQISLAVLPRARTIVASIVSEELAAAIPIRYALRSALSKPLGYLWVFGVTISVVYTAMALSSVRSLTRRCVPVHDGEIQAGLARLCRDMKIGTMPKLATVDWMSVPLLIRSAGEYVVVMPTTMLDPAQRDDLLLTLAHELAHIKRKDLAWNWLPTACRVLFFPNPLVWVACREMGMAQEMACDALAIRTTGTDVRQYGKLLLSMVTLRETSKLGWAASVAVSAGAPAKLMRQRLLGLKYMGDASSQRTIPGMLALALVCLLILPFQLAEAPRTPVGDRYSIVGQHDPVGDAEYSVNTRFTDISSESVMYVVRREEQQGLIISRAHDLRITTR
jgi:bla regulator protein BlaR1